MIIRQMIDDPLSSTEAKKSFENLFRVETLTKVGTKGTYLSTTNAMQDKRTANIILNDGKLKASLKAETRQACPLSPLLFNIALEPSHSNQKRKKKRIQVGKEEVKLSLFEDDLLLYMKSPKDYTKKLLELTNSVSFRI